MAVSKTAAILLVVGIAVGVVAGYGVGSAAFQAQITQLQSDLSETESALSASQAEIESLQSQLANAETQVSNLETDLAAAEERVTNLETEISSLESDLTDARNTIADYESQISDLEMQVADILSRITSRSGYERLLAYGFSLEYPELMHVSVSGLLSEYGADEHSGMLIAQKPDETEVIFMLWADNVYPRDLDDALDGAIAGTPGVTSRGERVTSTTNGHTIKYEDFTFASEGETYHAVIAYWNCDVTERLYCLEYMTIEEDAIPNFLQCLDSFTCH